MTGYNPDCFHCKHYDSKPKFGSCGLHGHVIPCIGFEVICADYINSRTGKALKHNSHEDLSSKIDRGELYYYYSGRFVLSLGRFESLGSPIIAAFVPREVFRRITVAQIAVPAINSLSNNTRFIEEAEEMKVHMASGSATARISVDGSGGGYRILLDDPEAIKKCFDAWFYMDRISIELDSHPSLWNALQGGVSILVEVISENEIRLRPNKVFMRECFGDSGVGRLADT